MTPFLRVHDSDTGEEELVNLVYVSGIGPLRSGGTFLRLAAGGMSMVVRENYEEIAEAVVRASKETVLILDLPSNLEGATT